MLWTLANHPCVPQNIRDNVSKLGLARDEFADNGNWPSQLYVREARRMLGDYVMTEKDCLGKARAKDGVGLGSYPMDSHAVRRYVNADGFVSNEGSFWKKEIRPYPISYRAIVPKTGECANLLVPGCLSASHAAYGSLRMEPVFMILGQSAATAATQAIEEQVAVQNIDIGKLRTRLEADGQVLTVSPSTK